MLTTMIIFTKTNKNNFAEYMNYTNRLEYFGYILIFLVIEVN